MEEARNIVLITPHIATEYGAESATTHLSTGNTLLPTTVFVISNAKVPYYETEKTRPFIYAWNDRSLDSSDDSKKMLEQVMNKCKEREEAMYKLREKVLNKVNKEKKGGTRERWVRNYCSN